MTSKTKQRIKGSISLMLVVIMIPLMALSAFIVDTSRYNMAKSIISSTGDLTLNSALADYDTVLKEVYGLFGTSQSHADWNKNIEKYFKDTLTEYGVSTSSDGSGFVDALLDEFKDYLIDQDKDTKDFINISLDSFKAQGHPESALSNPNILKKQIVEFMKYRAPANFAMSFLDSIASFGKVSAQTTVSEKMVGAQELTADINEYTKELYEKILDYDSYADGEKFEEPKDISPRKYRERILAYRDKYEANYKDIHYYYVGFQVVSHITELNSAGRTNLKELKKLVSEDKMIIKDGDNYTIKSPNKSNKTSSYESALDAMNKDLAVLEKDEYVKNAQTYIDQKYMDKDYISGNDFSNRDKAFEDYQKYNSFLSDLDKCKYSIVKDVAVAVDAAAGDFNRFCELVDKKIKEYEAKVKAADKKIEQYEEKIEEANEAVEKASEDMADADIAYYLAEEEGDQAAMDAASRAHENAEKAAIAAGNAKNKALEELKKAESEKTKNTDKKYELETKKTDVTKRYNNGMKAYYEFSQRFCQDANRYIEYKEVSGKLIEPKVEKISEEFQAIIDNLKVLSTKSKQIANQAQKVYSAIDAYEKKLLEWKDANDNYKEEGEDNFSKINDADIETSKSTYDKDSAANLRGYAITVASEIDEFLKFIESKTGVLYGVATINRIEDLSDLKSSVASSPYYRNNNIGDIKTISTEKIEEMFSSLYTLDENKMPDFKLKTYTKEAPLHEFVYYLINLHGNDVASEENQATKDIFDDALENGQEENGSGVEEEVPDETEEVTNKDPDEEKRDKYGYHYSGESVTITKDWPSGSSTGDEDPSTKIELSDEGTSTSESFSKQAETIRSTLSGIEKTLEDCRDDIYVLQYIFENFSYNTLIQDMKRNGDGEDSITLSGGTDYSKYVDKATTSNGMSMNYLNNQFYGAEIEYILYGKSSASANVSKAKDRIFAIRFGFNCLYAFTNSEIRNYAKQIGLAVQAATYGYVPYIIPMVITQLLLALGETQIDMKMMMKGMKVAVFKTEDTWVLSVSGAKKALTDMAKNTIKDLAVEYVQDGYNKAIGGIQDFIDSKAEDLKDAAGGLVTSLETATNSKINEVVSTAYTQFESTVSSALNELLYQPYATIEEAKQKVNDVFDKAIEETLNTVSFDDTIGAEVTAFMTKDVIEVIEMVRAEFLEKISRIPSADDIGRYMVSYVDDAKDSILDICTGKVTEAADYVRETMDGYVDDMKDEISGYVNDMGETVKDDITNAANAYIDAIFNDAGDMFDTGDINTTLGGTSENGSTSSLSSVFSFAYSDYLKLFLFLDLSSDETDQLRRLADMIQLNISMASSKSDLKHAAGTKFSMVKAYTYVTIEADINFPMMFLNMDLFSKQMDAYNEDIEEINANGGNISSIDLVNSKKITYQSIAGY